MKNKLKLKINNRTSTVGIIGLGYVGLPIILRFSELGFKVIGFDIDRKKIDSLQSAKSYIKHISNKEISHALENGLLPTSNFDELKKVDVIIICVPTPLKNNNTPNLSFIEKTLLKIEPHIKSNQLLVLESTTYPGTTEELIIPFIDQCGFKTGEDYFVGYSPERLDPGNLEFDFKNIPKVISGYSKNCLEMMNVLYSQVVIKTVPVSSLRVAEMTKMLENIQRSVNIGLMNELKLVADKMNIDIFEVINASASKPFGFIPYFPGPGLGGHCIPIDPFYLAWKAKKLGVKTELIDLAGQINKKMPDFVISKIKKQLKKVNKKIKDTSILILGIAYKKNTDDLRESPSLVILNELIKMGYRVKYHDPLIPILPKTRNFNFSLKSIDLNPDTIKSFDLVLIATDHDDIDYNLIIKNSKVIIDTRGKFNPSEKVVRA